ncbi:Vacuolar protein sorting-associated protein 13 [Nymphon striatum]|nr:Vacuolar protein sorting-associated protein 13 [Nymphon striatum]
MVFESLVVDLLNRFIGDYVENLDRSQLKIGIWGGDIVLKNLEVKQSALDDLDLPVKIISGHLGNLTLKIPWKNLYSAPVVASIDGLYVVVIPNSGIKYNEEKERKAQQESKQKELQRIEEAKERDAAKDKPQEKKKDSFAEKMAMQVVKNLQVTVKNIHIRFEDTFTNVDSPFAFGVTLKELSFITTDENWKSCVLGEAAKMIYKLISLDSLAAYWNSNINLLSKLKSEDIQKELIANIASKEFIPEGVSYLLEPINSTAQLKLNPKPENDGSEYNIPKILLNVIMQELGIAISNFQYQDILQLLQSFERMNCASRYRKYHPNVPHKGHSKEWWKFGYNCILGEDIRRRRKNWSWIHIKNHRDLCRKYKNLYKVKLAHKKVSKADQEIIKECEEALDLINLTILRKQAEVEVVREGIKAKEEKQKRGWLGGWLGGSKTDGKDKSGQDIALQFQEAMSAEEKGKLFSAIGYQENSTPTIYPKEFVENKLTFMLNALSVSVKDNSLKDPLVMKLQLKKVSSCIQQRPSADAINVTAKVNDMEILGKKALDGEIPQMITSVKSESTNDNLLDILFETNPLNKSCDQRVHIGARPLQIVYNAVKRACECLTIIKSLSFPQETVNQLINVFKPPEAITLTQLQAAAMNKLKDIKEMSASGLQHAIETHKYLDLKIDLMSSYIIVPEFGDFNQNGHLLLVDLGNVKINSTERTPGESNVKQLVRSGSTEDEIMTSLLDQSYDKFQLNISNIQILMCASDENWKSAKSGKNSEMHILRPTDLMIELNKCIIEDNPLLPKMKISGSLPLIDINISDEKLMQLAKLGLSIPLPQSETPYPTSEDAPISMAEIPDSKTYKDVSDISIINPKSNRSDSDDEKNKEEVVQMIDLQLDFEIQQICLNVSTSNQNETVPLMTFRISNVGTKLRMLTYEMSVELYLTAISLQHLQFFDSDGKPINIISTEVSSLEHLLYVNFIQVNKDNPDLKGKYESTLQHINVNFNNLSIVLHQDAILDTMKFANEFSSRMQSLQDQKSVIEIKPITEKEEIVEKETKISLIKGTFEFIDICLRVCMSLSAKKVKSEELIDMKLIANLNVINITICSLEKVITEIKVGGLNASVSLQKSMTTVEAGLKELIVLDLKKDALYPKIISTSEGQVVDAKIVIYNNATEDENYVDMNAVDTSVFVVLGCLEIYFLNRFVTDLLSFLDNFQTAKDKVAAASAAATEAAKQSVGSAYEKATRLLLDVTLKAPIIYIPQSSTSLNSLALNLGILGIRNKFQLCNKRNELGMPAILENMSIDLQNLKLSRTILEQDTKAVVTECHLLEPLSINLSILRNMSIGWYKEIPEIEIDGKISSVKLNMSQEDFTMMMTVLSENLSEGQSDEIKKVSDITSESGQVEEAIKSNQAQELNSAQSDGKEIKENVFKRLKFVFRIDCIGVVLYNGSSDLNSGLIERNPKKSLTSVQMHMLVTKGEVMSNNSLWANVILVNLTMDDLRCSRKQGITRYMETTVYSGGASGKSMVDITFSQDESQDKYLDLKVSSFTLICCLDYLMAIGDFFTKGMPTTSSPKHQTITSEPEVKSVPAKPVKQTSNTTIKFAVEKPDIILIEDVEDFNSNALLLNTEVKMTLRITPDVQNIITNVNDLQILLCCFNPEKRASTMKEILSPCSISFTLSAPFENGQHLDISFTDVRLHVSPGTIAVLSAISASIAPKPTEEETETTVNELDWRNLWNHKKVSDCNFWFLQSPTAKEATEISTSALVPANDIVNQNNEVLVATMETILIIIEANVGDRTIPMILLEANLHAKVLDWSSKLSVSSTVAIEIGYYNDKIARWEPLIEPVEAKNGRRPWELCLEVMKNDDVFVATSPDDSDEIDVLSLPPPEMTINIFSMDILEITVSKICLNVLTNLGSAFGEAVKTAEVVTKDKIVSPYVVKNDTGLPLTLHLHDHFKVLGENKDDIREVVLEPDTLVALSDRTEKICSSSSVLKQQDGDDKKMLTVKIVENGAEAVRQVIASQADVRFFQLPFKSSSGDKWGLVSDISIVDGVKTIVFRSHVQIQNHFKVPVEVYYMMLQGNEVQCCGVVEPKAIFNIPLYALNTTSNELFFRPKDGYSVALEAFVWKDLMHEPKKNKVLHCNSREPGGQPFFMNVSGDLNQVLFEDTIKKTMGSTCYKLNLRPTTILRNLLPLPLHVLLEGTASEIFIEESGSAELLTVEVNKTGADMRILGYLEKDWWCRKSFDDHVDELSVWTFESADDRKNTIDLGVYTINLNGSLVISLYCPFWMVNKTGLLLTYKRSNRLEREDSKDPSKVKADVSEYVNNHSEIAIDQGDDSSNFIYHPPDLIVPILFSFRPKNFFSKKKACVKIQNSEWSDKFSIDVVGSSGKVIAKSKDGSTFELGVQIRLSNCGLTKIVIFTPFYMISNNASFDIDCLENVAGSEWVLVYSKSCIPFWPKDVKKTEIICKAAGTIEQTPVFDFMKGNTTLLPLENKFGGINAESQVTESQVLISLSEYHDGDSSVLLVNTTSDSTIEYNQKGSSLICKLKPSETVLYTWSNPLGKQELIWHCDTSKKTQSDELIKDGIGDVKTSDGKTIYWVSFLDGLQRVLLLTEDVAIATIAQQAGELERANFELNFSLNGVGISVVNNITRTEVLYIGIASSGVIWEGRKMKATRFKALTQKENNTIEQAHLKYLDEMQLGKNPKPRQHLDHKIEVDFIEMLLFKPNKRHIRRSFQNGFWVQLKLSPHRVQLHTKINRLQIDNQLQDSVFPIVLAPMPPPKSVAADSVPKPFTEVSLVLRKAEHSTVQQFKYFKVLVQEFHIKMDQGLIMSLLEIFSPDEPVETDYEALYKADMKIVDTDLKALAAIHSSQEQKNFYDELHLSPLKVHISFSVTGGSSNDAEKSSNMQSSFVNLLLKSVGVTVTEIQDVVFKLAFFERKYKFMTNQKLISDAIMHYTGQAIKQMYVLVLGLDVIGNPFGLVLGLTQGVEDLFYEPFQGAIQGPEEFAEGLALGVRSLFGHALGGAAGAASRITGTLGKGIAALTMDDEYQKKRREAVNRKPTNVGSGLAQSGKGLVMGVFDGVTGIVTKPIEGAKEEGFEGFFKGVGKGLIGVVARPTAGAIDFASGSLDAIKKVAEVSEETLKLRPPRFIHPDGVIRPYIRLEAEGYKLLLLLKKIGIFDLDLQEVEKGKYANTDNYIAHLILTVDGKYVLLVSDKRVMLLSKGELFGQWNSEWTYSWDELKEPPTVTEKGFRILLKKDYKKKKLGIFGGSDNGKAVTVKSPESAKVMDCSENERRNYEIGLIESFVESNILN